MNKLNYESLNYKQISKNILFTSFLEVFLLDFFKEN